MVTIAHFAGVFSCGSAVMKRFSAPSLNPITNLVIFTHLCDAPIQVVGVQPCSVSDSLSDAKDFTEICLFWSTCNYRCCACFSSEMPLEPFRVLIINLSVNLRMQTWQNSQEFRLCGSLQASLQVFELQATSADWLTGLDNADESTGVIAHRLLGKISTLCSPVFSLSRLYFLTH